METITVKCQRPNNQHSESVYSNFDHSLQHGIMEDLMKGGICSQHAAWNFCGYIWHENGKWHEDVWIYNSLREHLEGDGIMDVIDEANDRHGRD